MGGISSQHVHGRVHEAWAHNNKDKGTIESMDVQQGNKMGPTFINERDFSMSCVARSGRIWAWCLNK